MVVHARDGRGYDSLGVRVEERMARLTVTLEGQFAERAPLEAAIGENLRGLGYGT